HSERGRKLYVYTAEVLLVLLFVHTRLTVPQLFHGRLAQYWPLIVMAVSFLGVGLGELFERRGLRVLAELLQRTGIGLRLLPVLAALAANLGLWALLFHNRLDFLTHPQMWLIPLALIVLVAEQINRDRLGEAQSTALRYLALLTLYVSSTADMFIAGLGESVA